jgi:hypothetical protein
MSSNKITYRQLTPQEMAEKIGEESYEAVYTWALGRIL